MFLARFGPQFSEPVLFRSFPALFNRLAALAAVFCPLNFLGFHVFLGFPVFFSWQQVLLYSLPLPFGKMQHMPKCNKQFQRDSTFWAMTVSQTDSATQKQCPEVLGDVTLSSKYSDLELDLTRLCVGRYWNQNNVRCHLPILEQSRTEKNERRGLQKERLRKQNMVPQALRGVLFGRLVFLGIICVNCLPIVFEICVYQPS